MACCDSLQAEIIVFIAMMYKWLGVASLLTVKLIVRKTCYFKIISNEIIRYFFVNNSKNTLENLTFLNCNNHLEFWGIPTHIASKMDVKSPLIANGNCTMKMRARSLLPGPTTKAAQ